MLHKHLLVRESTVRDLMPLIVAAIYKVGILLQTSLNERQKARKHLAYTLLSSSQNKNQISGMI